MKSVVLILSSIVLLQKGEAQVLWKAPPFNPGYSVRHQEHNRRIIYPEEAQYLHRSNTIRQSTFVPLKTLFEEDDAGADRQLNTNLFFTLDEWPLHLEQEEHRPETIVDDEYDAPPHNQHLRVPDVVSVAKTHFSLGPGNVKEEKTYFDNKNGQVHALFHTVEATIQGFDNSTQENSGAACQANNPNPKSEFTEETILINPEENLEEKVEDLEPTQPVVEEKQEEKKSESVPVEQEKINEENLPKA